MKTLKTMRKHGNPKSLIKTFPSNKILVWSKGYYNVYLLMLIWAFDQFGKLSQSPQVMNRYSEKLIQSLT